MSVGLVVNPLAGIGGPAGLAGSDGAAVQREALRRGGRPRGSSRAVEALRVLAAAHPGAEVLTAAGAMGEDAVREAGLVARVVYSSPSTSTSPDDTARAAAALHGAGRRSCSSRAATARPGMSRAASRRASRCSASRPA